MNKITFKCQAITPMFLGGADGEPDLRPPSIKGAMRSWWRAMYGHLPVGKLKEEESNIFGNTEQRSKIILRCKTSEDLEGKQFSTKGHNKNNLGLNYLFYSMDMKPNNRRYFDNIRFEVIMKSKDEDLLKEASYAFWLLANLGGIGSRSRRGGGNFVIMGVESSDDLGFDLVSDSRHVEAWVSYLKGGMETIKHHTKVDSIQGKTPFNSFQNVGIHLVNQTFNTSEKALDFIGQQFQQFRKENGTTDAGRIAEYLNTGNFEKNKTIEKASFGLPISYRFRQGGSATVEPDKDYNRSASSLFIRIVEINNKYHPLLVNFNSRLLPEGAKIKIKGATTSIPDNTIKQDFIKELNTIQIL